MTHGTRPRTGETRRRDHPLLQDLECGNDLLARIVLLVPRIEQCCERAHDLHRALVLAEIALNRPDREEHVAIDMVALLDGCEEIGLFRFHLTANVDADLGHRLGEILRRRRGELRLIVGKLEHIGIGIG